MTTSTASAPRTAAPPASPGAAFNNVISAALEVAASKVDNWINKLSDASAGIPEVPSAGGDDVADKLAEGGGATQQAGVRGVQAGLQGKNPVWAAIKGAWASASTKVRAAVVTAGVSLILLLVLSPVLLLVYVLTALILAAVSKARASKQ